MGFIKVVATTVATIMLSPTFGHSQLVSRQVPIGPAGAAGVKTKTMQAELLDRKAFLEIDKVPLPKALEELHHQARVPLVFSPSIVSANHIVSCACTEATVGEALTSLLAGTELEFTVRGGTLIIVRSDRELSDALVNQALATRNGGGQGPAMESNGRDAGRLDGGEEQPPLRVQTGTVAGRVMDGRALRPLAGVQVEIVGRGISVITSAEGRYVLSNVPAGDATLRAQFIGYATVERQITVVEGETIVVNIEMVPEAVRLDELVVTGTPEATHRRAIGNSVSRIEAADLVEVAPPANVGQLLTGRAAGVVLEQRSGQTGAGPQIRIRGASTFSLSDQPLIYIDGIRVDNRRNTGPSVGRGANVSRLNDINPADIESIEIIKGPAAATLYGTEAVNGVIQIITKRGRQGDRPEFSLSIRQGANWVMNPEGRFPPVYEMIDGEIVEFNVVRSEAERGTPIFRTGHVQGYGANVRGGSNSIQYYASGDYDNQVGTMAHDETRRLTLRGNLTVIAPGDKLSLTASHGYTRFRTSFGLYQVIWDAWSAMPSRLDERRGFYGAPPEAYRNNEMEYQEVDRFTSSFQLRHQPTEWFSHRLSTGIDVVHEENVDLQRRADEVGEPFFGGTSRGLGNRTERRVRTSNVTFDYAATLRTALGPTVVSSTSAGLQYFRKGWEITSASAEQFAAHGLTTVNAAARTSAGGDYVEDATVGVFVQQQFGWRDRLFLTAGLRADDNTAFGENFTFVMYPKVSATWVVSEEPFWNLGFANALKLRAAFGASGQQPATFAALRTYTPVGTGSGSSGFIPSAIGNPDLGPERGEELEVGFEAALFDQRIGIDFTYYRQRIKDAILSRNVAPSLGFAGTQFINAGEIQNTGAELLLNARMVETPSLFWELTVNLSQHKNKIIHLGGDESIPLDLWHMHVPGYPIGAYFMRRIVQAEIDENGVARNLLCDGGKENRHQPVSCDEAPRVYLGPAFPTMEGAITSTIGFADRLRLHVMFDFKRGHMGENGDWRGRCSVRRLCLENHYPHRYDPILIASIQNYPDLSHYAVEDASYLKLREIGLNFTLPEEWARSFGASRASVTAAARNLYTWTKWWGWEPETFETVDGDEAVQIRRYNKDIIPIPAQFRLDFNITY